MNDILGSHLIDRDLFAAAKSKALLAMGKPPRVELVEDEAVVDDDDEDDPDEDVA